MNQTTTQAIDATVSATASKVTYGGAGMTIGGWFLSSEFAVLVGMLVGIGGLVVNWYYKHKEDKRLQAEHELRMRSVPVNVDDMVAEIQTRLSVPAVPPKTRRRQRGRSFRLPIAVAGLSAAALVGLLQHEGYTDKAIIPVKGDRPTVGFGSTFRDDGSPVQMGDTITPPKAVARTYSHILKDESALKRCVTGPVNQTEYDLLVDHAYQYGVSATCSSSVVRHINAERYADACAAYLRWRFVAGRDCSVRANGCYGVWTRSEARHRKCMEAL